MKRRVLVPHADLADLRVLVVEDEFMIAVLIEETLQDHRCEVIGPFSRLADGIAAAQTRCPDAALLDVNLRGEKVFPLADLLDRCGVPFVLLSGYGRDAIPPDRPGWRACGKPFSPEELIQALAGQIAACKQQAAAKP